MNGVIWDGAVIESTSACIHAHVPLNRKVEMQTFYTPDPVLALVVKQDLNA
jgi:hypothetical protein